MVPGSRDASLKTSTTIALRSTSISVIRCDTGCPSTNRTTTCIMVT
jgi:hypothetical protein